MRVTRLGLGLVERWQALETRKSQPPVRDKSQSTQKTTCGRGLTGARAKEPQSSAEGPGLTA